MTLADGYSYSYSQTQTVGSGNQADVITAAVSVTVTYGSGSGGTITRNEVLGAATPIVFGGAVWVFRFFANGGTCAWGFC
jgi:hypothetical protein